MPAAMQRPASDWLRKSKQVCARIHTCTTPRDIEILAIESSERVSGCGTRPSAGKQTPFACFSLFPRSCFRRVPLLAFSSKYVHPLLRFPFAAFSFLLLIDLSFPSNETEVSAFLSIQLDTYVLAQNTTRFSAI